MTAFPAPRMPEKGNVNVAVVVDAISANPDIVEVSALIAYVPSPTDVCDPFEVVKGSDSVSTVVSPAPVGVSVHPTVT